jgi:hypothetical protein
MKIKKGLLFCIALSLATGMQAQVIMNLQLPPMGLTVKPQLWNFSLVNSGAANVNVRVELIITDVSTNQRVLTGTSNLFVLPKGAKQVRLADVMPVTYSIGSPGYSVDPSPDGFLPIGVFNICYSVINMDNDAQEKLSEECETVEIEPVSPPQLVMPADNEPVAETRPLFTWLPPSPFNSNNSLLYDWVLVEVQPMQTAAVAIQQNIPVLAQRNVAVASFQYPLSMPELDTAKLYAWRITAKNNTSPIANSEVWSFRIKKDQDNTPTREAGSYFVRLHKQEDAAYVLCNGLLRFEYTNDINANEVEVKVYDISSASRKPVALPDEKLPVQPGQNYMQLDLRSSAGMMGKHMYLLELRNAKNERWYLKFEYRKSTRN